MRRSKSAADMRTPMDLIIKRHPEKKKQIRKYIEKWTKSQQWPREGTFDPTCCDEMEAVIKHHKPNDKSDKREELRRQLNDQMEQNKQLQEQVGDQRREMNFFMRQDSHRRDEEAWRAENDRRYAQELLEEEEVRRQIQMLPEGTYGQHNKVRGRSPVRSSINGPAGRRPKPRRKRRRGRNEKSPTRSQPPLSEDDPATSMNASTDSGAEEEPSTPPPKGHKNRDEHSGKLERTYVSKLETKLSK
ncbi:hypothetical protein SKAU_G00234020 [Synaphobranchus kaupii]|uniref:Uncharacterized protein n=1 Tax=Synaphobranchus kaupii TaxID=118154 RepID=A0A9Q1ITN1_SYNKA|nr:hypothetical protein SKAU_G00234020 [Synaphobranchus kaupii]